MCRLWNNKGLEFVFDTVTNLVLDRQGNVKICIIAVKISDKVHVVGMVISDADAR